MSQNNRDARKALDLPRLRADTPGTRNRNHLNNAGAALMPSPVIDAVIGYLSREGEIGGYEAAAEANSLLEGAYDSLATFVNCTRDEIAIAENATIAWQRAFYSLSFWTWRQDSDGKCRICCQLRSLFAGCQAHRRIHRNHSE
ncbi:hypothetical protein LZK73_28875 (plasmid) [Neorhizobium galegae]|nr:hypothetical protein LZK73_28875 [Neorhizobium galegae]